MKKIYLSLFIALFATISHAQQNFDDLYLEKVKTLDSTIETLYNVISGEAGEKRDWDLFRYLFKKDAKLIPVNKTKGGKMDSRFLSPDDYVNLSGKWLEENGFFEKEIYRKTDTFGNITHIFSTYAAYRTKEDKSPFMRGINSMQLLYDGNRWWIINVYWMAENDEVKIPDMYLGR